jgi:hypothetical protein
MYAFKNIVLQREHLKLIPNIIRLERGDVGGCSIEVEIDEPKSFDSYLYLGKSAMEDREHDLKLLMKLFNEKTTE